MSCIFTVLFYNYCGPITWSYVAEVGLPRTVHRAALYSLSSLNLIFTHCKALSTLSHKSETVAENGDCRRIRRQSHFSATVWTGYKIPAALLAFRVAQNVRFFGPRTVSVTRDQTIVLRT